jgi:23S rRNA pseudouridine955/2504/2580 synthase
MSRESIEIVFEDDVLVVVNKPAGLPVHATLDKNRPNLHGVLEFQTKKPLVLFHRLDVDTTGLCVFGKEASINKKMTDAFRGREVHKTYWAVVEGRWSEHTLVVESYIKKINGGRYVILGKGSGGDHAITDFKIIQTIGSRSWIECSPQTGRTHQIRLHCQSERHPIAGDRLYGKADPRGVPLALHARRLQFMHPVSAKPLICEAKAPDYWKDYWLKGFDKNLV